MLKLKLLFSNLLSGGYLVEVHPTLTSPSRINGRSANGLRKITVNSLSGGCCHLITGLPKGYILRTNSSALKEAVTPLERRFSFPNSKDVLTSTWFPRTPQSWCFHSGTWAHISTAFWWARDVFVTISPDIPPEPRCTRSNLTLFSSALDTLSVPSRVTLLKCTEYLHPCLFQGFSKFYLLSCVSFTTTCLSLKSSTHQLNL